MTPSTDESTPQVMVASDAPMVGEVSDVTDGADVSVEGGIAVEADVAVEADIAVEADGDDTSVQAAEVTFTAPVLGLEHLSRFALVSLHEESPLFSLQSLEDEAVRLLVLMPDAVYGDYSPAFDAVSRAAVGLTHDADGMLLVVVNARESLADSTVNLLAPILVNPETGNAAQIVLTGTDYPLRAPIVL